MSGQDEHGAAERVPEHSGTSHALAIGYYVAAIILVFGGTLVLYGLLGPAAQVHKSLGVNVNLWWGLIMVVVGVVILALSYYSPRRARVRKQASASTGETSDQ